MVELDPLEVLTACLKAARSGQGLVDIEDLADHVRPELDDALDVSLERDQRRTDIVEKFYDALDLDVDPSERELVRVSLNLDGESGDWTYRKDRLAKLMDRSVRSVERRSDAALAKIAGLMLAGPDVGDNSDQPDQLKQLNEVLQKRRFTIEKTLTAVVRIDGAHVQVEEDRLIVTKADGPHLFVISKWLPAAETEIEIEALEGASLVNSYRPHAHQALYLLQLSNTAKHFRVRYETLNMAPMYTSSSNYAIEQLNVRTQVANGTTASVYRVDGFPPFLLRGPNITEDMLQSYGTRMVLDNGYTEVIFNHPKKDHSYGVGWSTEA